MIFLTKAISFTYSFPLEDRHTVAGLFFRGCACHSWAGIFKDITDAHTQAAAFYFSLAGRLLYVVLCSASGRISRRIRIREKRSSVFETLIVIVLYWLEREKAFLYEG